MKALVTSILQKEFPSDSGAYPSEDLDRLLETYAPIESLFLVAEAENHIVGTCAVKAESPKQAILRRLFVDPEHRGEGIGKALLKEALDFCRRRGYQEVEIRTSSRMEQAIRLCKAVGFEEQGSWTLGEVTLLRYRLRLA